MVRYDPRKPSKHVSKAPQPQTPQVFMIFIFLFSATIALPVIFNVNPFMIFFSQVYF